MPLPVAQRSPESGDLLNRIASVLKETGEAIDAAHKAGLERDKNTLAEKAKLSKEIDEAIVALLQLKGYYYSSTRFYSTRMQIPLRSTCSGYLQRQNYSIVILSVSHTNIYINVLNS